MVVGAGESDVCRAGQRAGSFHVGAEVAWAA